MKAEDKRLGFLKRKSLHECHSLKNVVLHFWLWNLLALANVSGSKEKLSNQICFLVVNDCFHCHLLLRLTERELRLAAGS